MFREMVKSKIERVIISNVNLDYKGSIGIDLDWIEKADLLLGEKVHVVNINNGERLETYVVEEPRGSKNIVLYGPAARKGMIGDKITIISYMIIDNEKAKHLKPIVVSPNE